MSDSEDYQQQYLQRSDVPETVVLQEDDVLDEQVHVERQESEDYQQEVLSPESELQQQEIRYQEEVNGDQPVDLCDEYEKREFSPEPELRPEPEDLLLDCTPDIHEREVVRTENTEPLVEAKVEEPEPLEIEEEAVEEVLVDNEPAPESSQPGNIPGHDNSNNNEPAPLKEERKWPPPMTKQTSVVKCGEPDDDDWAKKNISKNKVNDLIARFQSGQVFNNNQSCGQSGYKSDYGVGKVGHIQQSRFK